MLTKVAICGVRMGSLLTWGTPSPRAQCRVPLQMREFGAPLRRASPTQLNERAEGGAAGGKCWALGSLHTQTLTSLEGGEPGMRGMGHVLEARMAVRYAIVRTLKVCNL